MWRTSYLAMSAVLGVPIEEAAGALACPLSAECLSLAQALRATEKRTRARTLAPVLAAIARAVESARLR